MWGISRFYIFPSLVVLSLSVVLGAAFCTGEVGNHRTVSNTSDVEELADCLASSGPKQLAVDWLGEIELSRTLNISNGSVLNITGWETATIKGGGANRLFTVAGGATLTLRSILLEGGQTPGSGHGGAILVVETSHLNLHDCSFMNNTAEGQGGAVYADSSSLLVDGNSSFVDNVGTVGGAVGAFGCESASFGGDVSFENNVASDNGGGMTFINSNVTLSGHLLMNNNNALYGGAIAMILCPSAILKSGMLLANNSAKWGGALFVDRAEHLGFEGQWWLENNHAENGGAIALMHCPSVMLGGNLSFSDNAAIAEGGAAYLLSTDVESNATIELARNTALRGGAGHMTDSNIESLGTVYMTENKAKHGGGLYVRIDSGSSEVTLAQATFENNEANFTGGGGHISFC